jgi:hypothetical protein
MKKAKGKVRAERQPFNSIRNAALNDRPADNSRHEPDANGQVTARQHGGEQRNSHHPPRRALDVYLGVDLGTSFSKVVWRFGQYAYPLCFGNRPDNISDYLVPSLVYFDGENFATGVERGDTSGAGPDAPIRNFKMCLACEAARSGCQVSQCSLTSWEAFQSWREAAEREASLVTALFLSRLLARAQELVRAQIAQRGLDPTAVRWSAILAVPEKDIERTPVKEAFEAVFKAAWEMADKPYLMHKDEVLRSYRDARRKAAEKGESYDLFVYPEVVAEAASVTQARTTEDGLFAFVDVGAGTLDASVFRLHTRQAGHREHNTYAADVLKLGAARIEAEASRRLSRAALDWFKEMKESPKGEFTTKAKKPSALLLPTLAEAMERVQEQACEALIRLFDQARRKENLLSRWENLRLILGGGGVSSPAYHQAALDAFTLKYKPPLLPTIFPLPMPRDFLMAGLSPDYFHRFAVAYGLAFEYVNLREFALSGQVAALRLRDDRLVAAPGKDEC